MIKSFFRKFLKQENQILKSYKLNYIDLKNMSTLSKNNKFKIFVTQPIPEQAKQILEENKIEFHINETLPLSRTKLLEAVKGCDGLFCTLNEKIDKELIEQAGIDLKVP